ncbi:hypothetical protein D3C80_1605140 [compost metagenome]
MATQLGFGQIQQHALEAIQRCSSVLCMYPQRGLHFLFEVFQQQLAGLDHRFVDFPGEIALQLLEISANDFRVAAVLLVDLGNTPFEVHT